MNPDVMVAKRAVRYRPARLMAARRCASCAMFSASKSSCTLVAGEIQRGAVCDKWERPPAK